MSCGTGLWRACVQTGALALVSASLEKGEAQAYHSEGLVGSSSFPEMGSPQGCALIVSWG
jgi:hypothetical protein